MSGLQSIRLLPAFSTFIDPIETLVRPNWQRLRVFPQNLHNGRCVLGFKYSAKYATCLAEIRKTEATSSLNRVDTNKSCRVAGILKIGKWLHANGRRTVTNKWETPWRKNCSRGLKPEENARNKKCAAERAESSQHVFRISHATPPHSTGGWHRWLRKPPAKDDFGRKPEMTRREWKTDQLTPFVTRQSLLRVTELAGIFAAHVSHFQFSLQWQIFRPTVPNVVKVAK